jgi:hypothetical protein
MDDTSRPAYASHYEARIQVRSQGRLLQAPRIFFSAVDDDIAAGEGLQAVRERYRQSRSDAELVSLEVIRSGDGHRVSFLEGSQLAQSLAAYESPTL